MNLKKSKKKKLIPIINKKEINFNIKSVAKQISEDHYGKNVVFIGVLKGAFIFLSDLIRKVNLHSIEIDFLQTSSYGEKFVSAEKIILKKDISINISGKNIIIVEDIVDTGLTLKFLISHLKLRSPKSMKICTLIDKKERRKVNLKVDYACCLVKSGFLVGYGLDYAEKYRNLSEIYHMNY